MKKIKFKGKTFNELKEELGKDFDKVMFDLNQCLLIENDKLSNKIIELLNKNCEMEKNRVRDNKYLCLFERKDD